MPLIGFTVNDSLTVNVAELSPTKSFYTLPCSDVRRLA